MSTKIGTDGVTTILALEAPEGISQDKYDHLLTRHQRARDAVNMSSYRVCGGLEVPYFTGAASPANDEGS